VISNYVKPGDRVEIETIVKSLRDDAEEKKKVYRSSVYDIEDESQILIVMPIEQGKIVLLPQDEEFKLCFYTANGLYQCVARVAERRKDGAIYVLLFDLVTDLKKYQRREFYRLKCYLDMKSSIISEDVLSQSNGIIPDDIEFVIEDGKIVDISGGGARFISKVKYPEKSSILFIFSLMINNHIEEYKILSKVISSKELPNDSSQFEHRVKFANIMNDEREKIIKFIFEEERRIRKREKG